MRFLDWFALADGSTQVRTGKDSLETPTLSPEESERAMRHLEKSAAVVLEAVMLGVPAAWAAAVAWVEHRESLDTRNGIDVARALAKYLRKLDGGWHTLPYVASCYVVEKRGDIMKADPESPWQMPEPKGYLEEVVRTANSLVPWLSSNARP